MKNTKYYSTADWADSEINFWPSFIDMFASILMIFVLFAFIRMVLNNEALEIIEIKTSQDKFMQIFSNEFSKEVNEGKVKITSDVNFQRITFSSEILFESGSASISKHGQKLLSRLLTTFENARQSISFAQIQVEGHTDNVPVSTRLKTEFASNWELSSQRAINVVRYFIDDIVSKNIKLLNPSLFSGTGYGYFKPVASNDTLKGKALNRRIEIRLVYSSQLGKNQEIEGEI